MMEDELAPCCGINLVMNSQNGKSRIYCLVCGRTIWIEKQAVLELLATRVANEVSPQ